MSFYNISHTDNDLVLTARKANFLFVFAWLLSSTVMMAVVLVVTIYTIFDSHFNFILILASLVVVPTMIYILTWTVPNIISTARRVKTGQILRFDKSHDSLMDNGLPVATLSDITRLQIEKVQRRSSGVYQVMLTYKDGNTRFLQCGSYRECLDFAQQIADYVGVTVNAPSV